MITQSINQIFYFSHHMINLQYSSTGENVLVVAANAQAKVYDRDGHEVLECVKGDQYLNDMFNTAVSSLKVWLKSREMFRS